MDLPLSIGSDLEAKRTLFAMDWERRLAHLLPGDESLTFDVAWDSMQELMANLLG